ncbi:MAG: hypothetical protein ACI8X5_000718 [Planctomycetota bacterium]
MVLKERGEYLDLTKSLLNQKHSGEDVKSELAKERKLRSFLINKKRNHVERASIELKAASRQQQKELIKQELKVLRIRMEELERALAEEVH